jgi:GxxExxY protein
VVCISKYFEKSQKMITQKYINDIACKIVGSAIEVHKYLGPGLLEAVYHKCMIEELADAGFFVQSQLYVPIK